MPEIEYKKRFFTTTFKIRLKTAWNILTGKHKRWLLISLKDEDFEKMKEDKTFSFTFAHSKIVPYLYFKMLKQIADSKSDIDIILDKAQYEAELEIKTKKNK